MKTFLWFKRSLPPLRLTFALDALAQEAKQPNLSATQNRTKEQCALTRFINPTLSVLHQTLVERHSNLSKKQVTYAAKMMTFNQKTEDTEKAQKSQKTPYAFTFSFIGNTEKKVNRRKIPLILLLLETSLKTRKTSCY